VEDPLKALREFLDVWGSKLGGGQEESTSCVKEAITVLQEACKGQESKASKQARLRRTMTQLQARQQKVKKVRGQVVATQEKLARLEKQVTELDEDIHRLELEEKLLCTEVQEAVDPPTPLEAEGDAAGVTGAQTQSDRQASPPGADLAAISGLLSQLMKAVSGQKMGRKRFRDQGSVDMPADWGTQEEDDEMGSSQGGD
jgi:chromosome segregation ATPase